MYTLAENSRPSIVSVQDSHGRDATAVGGEVRLHAHTTPHTQRVASAPCPIRPMQRGKMITMLQELSAVIVINDYDVSEGCFSVSCSKEDREVAIRHGWWGHVADFDSSGFTVYELAAPPQF